jgi:hypothetical protein
MGAIHVSYIKTDTGWVQSGNGRLSSLLRLQIILLFSPVINSEKREDCSVVTVKYLHASEQRTAILEIRIKNSSPWPQSASELYRILSVKLVSTFADRGCHVVSVTDPYGHILGFLGWSCYFFFQVAPQLYSRGWVDPVPDPLLLRKSGSAGNRTRTSRSIARSSDH